MGRHCGGPVVSQSLVFIPGKSVHDDLIRSVWACKKVIVAWPAKGSINADIFEKWFWGIFIPKLVRRYQGY
jgi:hypothetical protein